MRECNGKTNLTRLIRNFVTLFDHIKNLRFARIERFPGYKKKLGKSFERKPTDQSASYTGQSVNSVQLSIMLLCLA